MEIELLYFNECPNHVKAENNLKQALQLEGMSLKYRKIIVGSPEMAHRLGFCGSPSIRINGSDLEGLREVSFSCRIYHGNNQTDGAPSVELIRNCLRAVDD